MANQFLSFLTAFKTRCITRGSGSYKLLNVHHSSSSIHCQDSHDIRLDIKICLRYLLQPGDTGRACERTLAWYFRLFLAQLSTYWFWLINFNLLHLCLKSLNPCNLNPFSTDHGTKNFIAMPNVYLLLVWTVTFEYKSEHQAHSWETKREIWSTPLPVLAVLNKDTGILEVILGNQSKACGNALRKLDTKTAILSCGFVICCPVSLSISCSRVCETCASK